MTFRAPVVAASLAAILVLPLAGPACCSAGGRPCSSPGCSRCRRCSRSTAAWCARTAVIALLAPAADARGAALARRRTAGVGCRLRGAGALCLWFHLATAPLLAAPFGLLVIETALARLRAERGCAASRRASARRAISRSVAGLARAPGRARSWCPPGDRCATSTPPRAASRASRSSWCRRSLVFRPAPPTGTPALTVTLLFWGLAAVGCRRPGAPARAARALPGGGDARAVGGARDPGADRTAQPDHLQSLSDRHPAAGAAPASRPVSPQLADRFAPPARRARARGVVVPAAPARAAGGRPARSPTPPSGDRRSSTARTSSASTSRAADRCATAVPPFYRDQSWRAAAGADRRVPVSRRLERDALALRLPDDPSRAGGRGRALRLALRRAAAAAQPRLLAAAGAAREPGAVPRRSSRSAGGGDPRCVGGDDTGNRYHPEEWEEFAQTAGRVTRSLRRRWGPPLYRDDRIIGVGPRRGAPSHERKAARADDRAPCTH